VFISEKAFRSNLGIILSLQLQEAGFEVPEARPGPSTDIQVGLGYLKAIKHAGILPRVLAINVTILSVLVLNIILLSVLALNVIALSVLALNVVEISVLALYMSLY
jgi:hypothetical protein